MVTKAGRRREPPYRACDLPPPCPRELVRRVEVTEVAFWRPWLSILPGALAVVGSLGFWLVQAMATTLSDPYEGRVVEVRMASPKGAEVARPAAVVYAYEAQGRAFRDQRTFGGISAEAPASADFAVGTLVTVRHVELLGTALSDMDFPRESGFHRRAQGLALVGLWVLVLGVAVAFFCWPGWPETRVHQRLLREGALVRGRVRRALAKGRSRGIAYTYVTEDGALREGEALAASNALASELREGDEVSVLHDPRDPNVSCVYEIALYRWTGR